MMLAAQMVVLALAGSASVGAPSRAGQGAATPAHGKAPPARATSKSPPSTPHVFVKPAPPLPMLPSIARVRVEAGRDRVVVTEEVNLPRGDWESKGLDLYVAFGAPGTPTALDARLVSVPRGSAEARLEDAGEPVGVEAAVHHTPSSQLLLGRPQMAGVVVHVKETELRRAYANGELAVLRIRSLLAAPATDAQGGRDIVVRLGVHGGLALTLGRVQLVSLDVQSPIARAQATLCGPDADTYPLSVSILPKPTAPVTSAPTIAPSIAVRRGTDDLCLRWWTGR